MTAFVVSSGGVTEWDALTGGSVVATLDTYTISANSTLRIAVDSYQCLNHSVAFGSLDTVSFSGIGGKLLVDPTQVRVVAFGSGAGTVPAIGATITQAGVTGVLLGVWANWQSEPLAAAAAMPVTGFLKFKTVTGGAFAVGALAGISASATEASRQGWIEVRGADTATITVPRIGAFEVAQAWFELGTTSGVRGQILPCPTTATVAGVFPGVWIETGVGTGVYERFCGVGSMAALASAPTDERGKMVWSTITGIRIGNDGTNGVGFLPPSGCRVRIPAAILTCCVRTVTGSGPRVLPNAVLATRQEFVTTGAGDIVIDGAVMHWYGNFLQAFRANVRRSAISDSLILQEIAAPILVDDVIVAPTQAQVNFALNMTSCFAGGAFSNTLLARFSLALAGVYVASAGFCKGVAFTNVKALTLQNRANVTTGGWTTTQNIDCTWSQCTVIGGRFLANGLQRAVWSGTLYADNFSGTTQATNPHYAFDLIGGCVSPLINGLSFMGLADVHPYNGLVSGSACYNIRVRNIATAVAPLSLGSTNASGLIFNGAGNNDGVLVQRVYTALTRTGPYSFLNSDNNITFENVTADFADASPMAALNATLKSVTQTSSTVGQVSVYGTHWASFFTSGVTGKISISCNEPTTATAAQCSATGGTPRFNSSGSVALTAIGDQVTWEMPFFALGATALANLAPTLTGTTTGNMSYEFQHDKGAGYNGVWLALSAANLAGAGAVTPSVGVRLKVRATCAVASAANLLTDISVPFVTTLADQQNSLYPTDTATLTLTGLSPGSDVFVLQAGTTVILAQSDAVAASTFAYTYAGTPTVDVGIIKQGLTPLYIRNLALPSSNSSIPVAQTADRNYA